MHIYKKNIIIVEAFLLIIAITCISSLDALMFYKGAQNDFLGNYMHDQYKMP